MGHDTKYYPDYEEQDPLQKAFEPDQPTDQTGSQQTGCPIKNGHIEYFWAPQLVKGGAVGHLH